LIAIGSAPSCDASHHAHDYSLVATYIASGMIVNNGRRDW
jgi:hypothetical protein